MRQFVYSLHKYLSLILGLIWFVQILSGVILVFAPEITDLRYSKPVVTLDPAALEKSINRAAVQNPDWKPSLIFTTSKEASRFDVYFYHQNSDSIGSRAVRIDGDGEILADRMMKWDFLNRVSELHEMLWIEDYGYIILGISGIFLCSNLALGLLLIWPSRKKWKSFFSLSSKAPIRIKFFNWHRLLGLCLLVPGFFVIFTGVLNIWLGDMKGVWGDPWPAPQIAVVADWAEQDIISLSEAINIAFNTYPGAKLSILSLPSATEPYYMVRLLQEGEIREVYGNTKLYISALNGTVLANYDQLNTSIKAQLFSSFFSLHLGNFMGMTGRFFVFLTGVGLFAISGIGGMLWWKRRVASQGVSTR